jgi:hypothetical protein
LILLLNFFVDLCLLRRAPQDLPASSAVLALTFGVNLVVGVLLIVGTEMGPLLSLAESTLELLLMLAVLRGALIWRGMAARFQQTASAIMGSSALLGLVALPLLGLAGANSGSGGGFGLAELGGLLLLALMVWNLVVLAHILRHALNLVFSQALVIGVLYTFASYAVIDALFPLG